MKNKLKLLKGEKILWEGKALKEWKKYIEFKWSLSGSILALSTFVGVIFIPVIIWLVRRFADDAYKQRYYWVTNKRVVYRRGLWGYRITSIPLERVSDVIISRSFLENRFGISSVRVQSLAGQVSSGYGGAEGDLAAVSDPEKVQSLILEQMRKVRE